MSNDLVKDVVYAAGGEVVGKIRLQKIIYLLEQLGMNSGKFFAYHHYGPYSEDVALDIDYAKFMAKSVTETTRERVSGEGKYSVFHLNSQTLEKPNHVGDLGFHAAENFVSKMQRESSVVLELAATIHWLKYRELYEDWKDELVARKGIKTKNGRMERAQKLLDDLGLA